MEIAAEKGSGGCAVVTIIAGARCLFSCGRKTAKGRTMEERVYKCKAERGRDRPGVQALISEQPPVFLVQIGAAEELWPALLTYGHRAHYLHKWQKNEMILFCSCLLLCFRSIRSKNIFIL